jgi:hypothetical protein
LGKYIEWKKIEFQKKILNMNLEETRLRSRPRNRWQDEVRRMVGKGRRKGYIIEKMEEAPENGKESSHLHMQMELMY